MRHDAAVSARTTLAPGFLDDWAARLRAVPGRPTVAAPAARQPRPAGRHRAQRRRPGRAGRRVRRTRQLRAYLAQTAGRLAHVSVAAAGRPTPGSPGSDNRADWAFGLPVAAPARLLWADPAWRPRIDLPVLCQPGGEPRLEELIATLGKAAGALAAGDDDRGPARRGRPGPALPVGAALGQPVGAGHLPPGRAGVALGLPVAPPGYRDDMLLCLGLRPGATGQVGRRRPAGRRHARRWSARTPRRSPRRPARTSPRRWSTAGWTATSASSPGAAGRPRADHGGSASAVPAPRAGQWVTVPVPDAPVTGAPVTIDAGAARRPAGPRGPGSTRRSRPGCAATPTAWWPRSSAQHDTGEVLMVAWMDDEALHRTLTTGRATYWSRSRREYWVKGATSGHHQYVRSVALDCDGDAVLVDRRPGRRGLPHRRTAPASSPSCRSAAVRPAGRRPAPAERP